MSHAADFEAMKSHVAAKRRAERAHEPRFDVDPAPSSLPTVRRRSDPLPPDLERALERWRAMKDAARRAWLWGDDLRAEHFALRDRLGPIDSALREIAEGVVYIPDRNQTARTQLERERASIVDALKAIDQKRRDAAERQRERSVLLARGKEWLVANGAPAELVGDSNVAGHAPARESTIITIR